MKSTRLDRSASNVAIIMNVDRPNDDYVCMEVMGGSLAISVRKGNFTAVHFADLDDAEQALTLMLAAVQAKRVEVARSVARAAKAEALDARWNR